MYGAASYRGLARVDTGWPQTAHSPVQAVAYLLAARLLQAAVLNAQRLRRTCWTEVRAAIGLKCAVILAIRQYRRRLDLLWHGQQQRRSQQPRVLLGVSGHDVP